MIRPNKPLFEPGEDYQDGKITIVYKSFQFTVIKDAIEEANYCTQDILFFCADAMPSLTGNYGLFSEETRLGAGDYELRDIAGSGESLRFCSRGLGGILDAELEALSAETPRAVEGSAL